MRCRSSPPKYSISTRPREASPWIRTRVWSRWRRASITRWRFGSRLARAPDARLGARGAAGRAIASAARTESCSRRSGRADGAAARGSPPGAGPWRGPPSDAAPPRLLEARGTARAGAGGSRRSSGRGSRDGRSRPGSCRSRAGSGRRAPARSHSGRGAGRLDQGELETLAVVDIGDHRGIAARPAARAARQRRSPTSSWYRSPARRTTTGCSTPCCSIESESLASASGSKRLRGCSGLGSMRSTGISPGEGLGRQAPAPARRAARPAAGRRCHARAR